jgi:trans-aconitate 2-methyltransferase
MPWNPELYLRHADHRLRPALDLLARLGDGDPGRIVDLGCGPGNVTRLLRQRWPDADITGIDSSAEMLARAAADHPGLRWRQQDIAAWRPRQSPDLIFTNAALHWLDHHDRLFPALLRTLAPGGRLAVQMPRNFAQPSHALLRQVASQGPWAEQVQSLLRPEPVAAPSDYWRLLAPLGAELDIWETDYLHVLAGEDAVLGWVAGTALRPFLAALADHQREAFIADYRQALRQAYPMEADGSTLFPFRRLFLVAQRKCH